MHILVTNDDGVAAPGLFALANALRGLGKISILAPDRNWSGGGHVKTIDRPLRVRDVVLLDGTPAFASDGAPSDCVALGLLGFFPEKIDLVVSGINPMANIGHDVTYSGTVTAAMEAVIAGVPAVAISLNGSESHPEDLHFGPAAHVARRIVRETVKNGLPKGILLNVNVPDLPLQEMKGIMHTRQGLRIYRDRLDRRQDPRGKYYYWIAGEEPTAVAEKGTDYGALDAGYVSITPLQLDLTAYPALHAMVSWKVELYEPAQFPETSIIELS